MQSSSTGWGLYVDRPSPLGWTFRIRKGEIQKRTEGDLTLLNKMDQFTDLNHQTKFSSEILQLKPEAISFKQQWDDLHRITNPIHATVLGRLDLLLHLTDLLDKDHFAYAIINGHLHVVQWLFERGISNPFAVGIAIQNGRSEILEWLIRQGFKVTQEDLTWAEEGSEILEGIRSVDDTEIIERVFQFWSLYIPIWIEKNGFEPDPETAVTSNRFELVDWLIKVARATEQTEIADWLIEQWEPPTQREVDSFFGPESRANQVAREWLTTNRFTPSY